MNAEILTATRKLCADLTADGLNAQLDDGIDSVGDRQPLIDICLPGGDRYEIWARIVTGTYAIRKPQDDGSGTSEALASSVGPLFVRAIFLGLAALEQDRNNPDTDTDDSGTPAAASGPERDRP
ncbi:hypothetical protein [Nocardia sp. NPDC003963]